MKNTKWICYFSQSGSEICNIIQSLNFQPFKIITNRNGFENIDPRMLQFKDIIKFIPNRPKSADYEIGDITTLHGYLRIIPDEICEKGEIYNLHPGLITKYPELKGFNPQEKAYKMKLKTSGAVIHRVTPELDSGKIVDSIETNIENKSLEEVYRLLHNDSTKLWLKFFNERGLKCL